MNVKRGFDNKRYLIEQSRAILERVERFKDKLYLELGGKVLFDYHAARVLPGFDPNVKMRLLQKLKDKIDVILCIYAGDIEKKKVRADFGITYDVDALKTIDDFKGWGIAISAVVITRFENQPSAIAFKNKLQHRGIRVYTHGFTNGYPYDVDTIVSQDGYGRNQYIETSKPIVVITGPGPGSGKLATCLSQMYHDHMRGVKSGYAKFETFPIWNLPLKHPVNVAYEAATAELGDVNVIDHFHLDAYDEKTVNYNRDVDAFPLLKRIIEKITGGVEYYKSPTDMGVNKAGFGITDDEIVSEAAKQEVIRRCFRYQCEYTMGLVDRESVQRVEKLMENLGIKLEDRKVVGDARRAAHECRLKGKGNENVFCGAAIELPDGSIITGKNSSLMHASSSLILNSVKHLAKIPDNMHLLPPSIIESIRRFRKDVLNKKMVSLNLEETLIALCISAATNPAAEIAVEKLKDLRDCEVHLTHLPTPGDEAGLRKLRLNITCDPNFSTKDLFVC
ncbi:MAG TPA: DUF1846 domain-containing protein [bacterium]|nr:DUF1846 domain-containing protein [Myxococcales bacterium]OQA60939.1 MAG: hypothetical protein BWY40_00785 [bacterium ADurb.Bin270]HPW45846.1 DUF1846 domain-containing protein [bacterium]HQC51178.1 DUF1846 domain-containing protein [bacterium]HQH80629.1 DUF1846 domain-containing protein [bacterium]